MADSDLPVFSFRPNFKEPMVETLSFLTDVLRSPSGAEQRRSLRETPRRTFEGDFLLTGPERTFWANYIDALGGLEMMVPLYWEVVSLKTPLTTAGTRIDFDTAFREWPYFTGGLALLSGKTALDYEVIGIDSVDANGIELAAPVSRTWGRGTKVYPLSRAVIEQAADLTQKSALVATTTAQFRFNTANRWTPAMSADPVYAGRPVLLEEPNWVADLAVGWDRDLAVFDPEIGRTFQKDPLGRAFVGQSHRWFLNGRERLASFRDLVYRNRGRTGSFWLPTFKADFQLAETSAAGDSELVVQNTGFYYTGGVKPGRDHLAIRHSGGTILRRITSVTPGDTAETEKLGLDSPVGLDLSPGLVRKMSFMDASRFDDDDFDITHYSGVDGLHECSSRFRAFVPSRTTPSPISYPIAISVMSDDPCGIPTPIYGEGISFKATFNGNPANSTVLDPTIVSDGQMTLSFGVFNANPPNGNPVYAATYAYDQIEKVFDVPPARAGMQLVTFTGGALDYTVDLAALPSNRVITFSGQINTTAFAYSEDLNAFGGYWDISYKTPVDADWIYLGEALLTGSFRSTSFNY